MEGKDGNANQGQPQENHPQERPETHTAEPRPDLEKKPPSNQGANGNHGQPQPVEIAPLPVPGPPEPKRWYTDLSVTDWITAVSTAIIMIWAGLQWWEMHSGGVDTHTLAQQAVTQATQTTNLASATGTQAAQTKVLADQAVIQAVDTLTNSQKSFRDEQRAWVGVQGTADIKGFTETEPLKYDDAFGKPHETQFCVHLANPDTKEAGMCDGFNDLN